MKHPARLSASLAAAALLLALAPAAWADEEAASPCLLSPAASHAEAALDPALATAELPTMTPAPVQRSYFWAWYEEFWKDGGICRWYDSCQNVGSGWCPNGYDYRTNEIFPCYR